MSCLKAFLVCVFMVPSFAEARSGMMVASWYKDGTRTANGENFNKHGLTAAHKTLPFGTKLLLTHGNKSVTVRINDRGPFIRGRHIDLSLGSAKALGCLNNCTVKYMEIHK